MSRTNGSPMDDVTLLEGLLRRYSPTGSEDSAVSYLVDAMNRLGYAARIDHTGNAVGVLGDGPREIVLLGHIDTVSGEIPVQREGDRLYGRGAVDAKGPLACFTCAAARLGARPGWRIVVIGALAEEGDSRGARGILDEYRPEAAIIGEPSGWERVTLGYKGSAWVTYRVEKPMEHTAARSESAAELAVAFWNRLYQLADRYNREKMRVFEELSPSLREMRTTRDGFSETAELEINFRLPEGVEAEVLMAQLIPMAGVGAISMTDFISAYRGEKNSPLVRAFLPAIRRAGGQPAFSLKTGTADINIVAPAWNCPAVAYGPGDSSLDHTPEEHILMPEYLKSIDVLEEALRTFTAVRE